MSGSKVKIWKQDPSVKPIGIRTCYIHTGVEDGPKDSEIEIIGMPYVIGNSNNDFLFSPEENPKEFDSVHTYTVVRQVLTMYKRALKRAGIQDEFTWQWGPETALQVFPRAGIDRNAYYNRTSKCLRFYYFHPNDNEALPLVYTCRSFDIVAHETGHAILDALKPGLWARDHAQTGGLHESFGDLTAIFTMLAQLDQCEAIIAESKANLHTKTFFPIIAEQFGKEYYGRTTGLRNADNDLKLSQVSTQVHDISKVFTGAIYDILADYFEDSLKQSLSDPAESIFRVGKNLCSLVLNSILKGPDKKVTYKDIADKMIELETDDKRKEIIRNQFRIREVLDGPAGMAPEDPKKLNWNNCCMTMQQL